MMINIEEASLHKAGSSIIYACCQLLLLQHMLRTMRESKQHTLEFVFFRHTVLQMLKCVCREVIIYADDTAGAFQHFAGGGRLPTFVDALKASSVAV